MRRARAKTKSRPPTFRGVKMPIRYAARTYGETQISRFRHGILLFKMVIFAFFRIKAL